MRGRRPGEWQLDVDAVRGLLNEGSRFDLKGLTATEAKGGRVTVWYEEDDKHKHTGAEVVVDVPYSGGVINIDPNRGIHVMFFSTLGADGRPERIFIGDEDDWMWGVRRTKAASWKLFAPQPRVQQGGAAAYLVLRVSGVVVNVW